MTTAATLVKQILNEINVRSVESELEADEIQDTLFALNAYMLTLDANGIKLGFTEVENLGDSITVPGGAIMGIIANVAVMMAPTFGVTVSQETVVKAKIGLSAMRKLGVKINPSQYPQGLPIGSGNEHCGHDWYKFYYNDEEAIENEQGGTILTEV